MKSKTLYIMSAVMFIICAISFVVFGAQIHNDNNIEFLNSYGWDVCKNYTDKCKIIIPDPFDNVYENYNRLQLEAGLDLLPYCGKSGTRYTYQVTNYPIDVHDTVYANVIVIDNTCVGGDIMTLPLDGFMHSLSYKP